MATSPLETYLLDALKKAKGSQTKARTLVLSTLKDNPNILFVLVKPYLNAIVAHALSRVVNSQKKKSDQGDLPPVPKKIQESERGFGIDLLKALGGGNVPKFGQEDAAPVVGKRKASTQHVDALKMMAAKSKNKPR